MHRQFLKPKKIKVPGNDEFVLARCSFPGSGRVLPPEGDWRPKFGREGGYWRRRINDGSVEVAKPPKKKTAPKKAED